MMDAEEIVKQYLTMEQTIKALEQEKSNLKGMLEDILLPSDGEAPPDTVWEYHGVGRVCWVKGRAGRKTLNRAKLVQHGVTADVLEACTDKTPDGAPHLRIERPKE